MTRTIAGLVIAVGAVAVISAQAPPAAPARPAPARAPDSTISPRVKSEQSEDRRAPEPMRTLTGCLRQAPPQSDARLVGMTQQAYDLVDAEGLTAKRTYTVKGLMPPGVFLKNLVGHKVQVMGTVTEDKKPVINIGSNSTAPAVQDKGAC